MKYTQPKSLWVLCLTETCERYGFYTIQSIIALYLTLNMGLTDAKAYTIGGAFTAFAYIAPIMGGWLADHYIGQKKAIVMGGIVLCASYLGLAFSNQLHALLFSLAMVAVGTGLLKPNISSILGRQYQEGDPHRNTGFTLFYMGLNLGIFLGTTIPVQIQLMHGWPLTFISAFFAIILGLIVFGIGNHLFKIKDYMVIDEPTNKIRDYMVAFLIFITFLMAANYVFDHEHVATMFFIILNMVCLLFVLWIIFKEDGHQRLNTLSFLLLCFISVIFWSAYFQIFLVLSLFISRCVEPHWLGMNIAPQHYVALQSAGIMVFGYFLQKLWMKRPDKNIAYGVGVKFSIAVLLLTLAYALIVIAIGDVHSQAKVAPGLVLLSYLLISLAELMLSPIGLSAVTMLVRPNIVSTMTGIFFVTLGLGAYLSGKLALLAQVQPHVTDITVLKQTYHDAFMIYIAMLFGAFLLSMIVTFTIRRLFQRHQRKLKHAA